MFWTFCSKTNYLKMEKIQDKALKIVLIAMNPLKILFCTAMKGLFIKNSYVNWLLKFIKV